MDIKKYFSSGAAKKEPAKTAPVKIAPSQDNMIKSLCDMMSKNTKIDKNIINEQFNKAVAEWQKMTRRPLKDEIGMVPIERIRTGRAIFDILKDNLSDDFRGKKYEDQINRALDITLRYYEDYYAYRK